MTSKPKMTLADTVKWLKKNVNPVEGFAAAKLKAKKAGVNVYPRAWGAAFGAKKPVKKPGTKKGGTKKIYGKRRVLAAAKPSTTSFTIVIESGHGRTEMTLNGAHVSLDTAASTLTVKSD